MTKKLGQAFDSLIDRLRNPDLVEGAEELISLYQDNLITLTDVEGEKSNLARAIAQRSPILFTIANSFLYAVTNSEQKLQIINKVPTSGLLNTRFKYAGFDSNRRYLNIFLNTIYKK